MTNADVPRSRGSVRVLVTEPVAQNLGGGRQFAERRDSAATPRKADDESLVLGEAVAGNARRSRRLPTSPLDAPPAPTTPEDDEPCLCDTDFTCLARHDV